MTGLEQKLNRMKGSGQLAVPEISKAAREMAQEGIVLLKNENEVLPIKAGDCVAVFGRCAINYFTVGYGSGGDVVAPYKSSLMDGFKAAKVNYNKTLAEIYEDWCTKNAPKDDEWGVWPTNYPEMPIDESAVCAAAQESNKAIVVIGRAAGEDRESKLEKGSFYLTDIETDMLNLVLKHFKHVCVVLDSGNIVDMEWTAKLNGIDAIVYAWQGGMESGYALTDILTGAACPSGRLTDTIAVKYSDYPGSSDFGGLEFNNYVEDIYVGYRYFETFCPEKVLYPFGFGLSYTSFSENYTSAKDGDMITVTAEITNTGKVSGKQVVQVYLSLPCGKLGNPAKVLAAFGKTAVLEPGASEELVLTFDIKDFAPFDDSGITGERHSFVLESGDYSVYAGVNIRETEKVNQFRIDELRLLKTVTEVSAVKPENVFDRMVNDGGKLAYAAVPAADKDWKQQILSEQPEDMQASGEEYVFSDILSGKCTVEQFVAQLSIHELDSLTHGEGPMDSAYGVKGNAGAFGGVTEQLRSRGIPACITTDGPSGLRIRYTVALLPCGTALASSFNTEGVKALYALVSKEMVHHGSDMLLAPGLNIHRNPLCGRNFEYYSEDPLMSGKMATAAILGIQSCGRSACPKHFACNNQEIKRNRNDSRVSERALREIYLRGFEIAVKEAKPMSIMTSYNKVNGVWSHYNYGLATQILRNEWGYDGVVITDWWMQLSASPEFPQIKDCAYRVRAQVDVLMPGGLHYGDNEVRSAIAEGLKAENGLTMAELRRCAANVIKFLTVLEKAKK